jgi:hypothetical protein
LLNFRLARKTYPIVGRSSFDVFLRAAGILEKLDEEIVMVAFLKKDNYRNQMYSSISKNMTDRNKLYLFRVKNSVSHQMPDHVGRVLLVADENFSASHADVFGFVAGFFEIIPDGASRGSRSALSFEGRSVVNSLRNGGLFKSMLAPFCKRKRNKLQTFLFASTEPILINNS